MLLRWTQMHTAVAMVVCLMGLAGSMFYGLVIDPMLPVTRFEVAQSTPRVERGSVVVVSYYIERDRFCPVLSATPAVYDSAGVSWPLVPGSGRLQTSTSEDGRLIITRGFAVPRAASVGPASLVVSLNYQCFILPIEVSTPPVEFEIVEESVR